MAGLLQRLTSLFASGGAVEEEPSDGADGTIVSPVTGTVVALADVADKVFSSGALGPGVGVVPETNTVRSPLTGTVVSAMPHAYGIRSAAGVEVLVHVGIDTVRLDGKHFTPRAVQGETVSSGTPLVDVDFEALSAEGFDTTTLVIVLGSGAQGSVDVTAGPAVSEGGELLTIDR